MRRSCLIATLIGLPCLLAAQDTLRLTLSEALATGLRQGYAVQRASSTYLSSRKTLEAEIRRQRTSVNLNLSLPSFRESLSSQFNPTTQRYEYYQIQTTELQSNLVINQPLPFTGGTLSFQQSLLSRGQASGLTSTSTTDYFSTFYLQFRQPLWTPNTYRQTSERNDIQRHQAEAQFLKDKLDIVYEITNAFYQAYQLGQRLAIAREQVRQNEDAYTTAKNKFNGGLIPEVDYLQSEVDLVSSRNDLGNAEREFLRSMNALRLLIGIPADRKLDLAADLSFAPLSVDENKAVAEALGSRTEVLSAQSAIDLRQLDVESAEARNAFRMDVVASYGVNGNDPQFNRVFTDFDRTRTASLSFSIPLFDWGSSTLDIQSAEILHRNAVATYENTQAQIRLEIIDLINRLRSTASRVEALQKNVGVAQKSYDISIERFRSGNINSNDLAQAQQRLTTAKLNSLGALIDYQVTLADLTRRTLWDFRTDSAVKTGIDDVGR